MSTNDPFWEYATALLRYEDDLRRYRRDVQQKYARDGVVILKDYVNGIPARNPVYRQSAIWWWNQKKRDAKAGIEEKKEGTCRDDLFHWRLSAYLSDLQKYRNEIRSHYSKLGVHIPDADIGSIPIRHPLFKKSGVWITGQRVDVRNFLEGKPCGEMDEKRLSELDQMLPNVLRDTNDEILLWNLRVLKHDLPLFRAEIRTKYARYGIEVSDDDVTAIPFSHPQFGHSGYFQMGQKVILRKYLEGKKTTAQAVEHLHTIFGKNLDVPDLLVSHSDEEFILNGRAYRAMWTKMGANWPNQSTLPKEPEAYNGLEIDAHELGSWALGFLNDWRTYEQSGHYGMGAKVLNKSSKSTRCRPHIMLARIEFFKQMTGIHSPYLADYSFRRGIERMSQATMVYQASLNGALCDRSSAGSHVK